MAFQDVGPHSLEPSKETTLSEPNAAVLAAAQNTPKVVNEDGLAKLRAGVAKVRELEAVKADLEERLKDVNIELWDQYHKHLPDLMDAAGVPKITIEAEGNMPRVEAEAQFFYKAGILADWPDEQRAAAFSWLDKNGHGDLIKTQAIVEFNREDRPAAVQFIREQRAAGKNVTAKEAVHHGTLTSWLREQVEKHKTTPPLDIIGGQVGRIVKLKQKD